MNIKAITLVAVLGLCVPAITNLAITPQALADEPQPPTAPTGGFTDGLWTVSLWYVNNSYNYSVKNHQTGASLYLAGAEESVDSDRRIYTWHNGMNDYQVLWQPSDPRVIRLQVIAPNGKQVLSRLLRKQFN
jgi:hypothetical protein